MRNPIYIYDREEPDEEEVKQILLDNQFVTKEDLEEMTDKEIQKKWSSYLEWREECKYEYMGD